MYINLSSCSFEYSITNETKVYFLDPSITNVNMCVIQDY